MADSIGRFVAARVDQFGAARGWQRHLIACALGVIASTGQAPLGLWPLSIFALASMIAVAGSAPTRRRAFWQMWWFGLGYFAVSLHWIVSPFLVEPEVYGWMAPFALFFMAAGAAVFWGLAGLAAHRLVVGSAMMLALCLAGVEVLRALILTGFPWALLGHIWIETPLARIAAFAGPHALTLISVLLAWALIPRDRTQRAEIGIVVTLVIVTLLLRPTPISGMVLDAPIVRLIQPNAPQDEKWDIDKRHVFFDRMVAFTQANEAPDLVVWPETAIPQLLEYSASQLAQMTAAARGAPIITGANRGDGARYYNTFVVIDGEGYVSDTYDKAHLVPFGEYIPFGDWLGGLGILGVAPSEGAGFSAGRDQGLINIPGIGAARALICYEGIFAEEITTGERPRLMVLITNDAWFGPAAGPKQHLAQARLRAIEQGLPMVRVANTGISAMIDAQGRITGQIGMNQNAFLDVPLPPALPPTLYVRWGDWPVIAFLLLAIVGHATVARRILH